LLVSEVAAIGFPQAGTVVQNDLGVCYAVGSGIAVDKAEAVKWYKRAADAGDANAQNNLGVCYAKGAGVAVNKAEAVKWWKRAAAAGHAEAQNFCRQL